MSDDTMENVDRPLAGLAEHFDRMTQAQGRTSAPPSFRDRLRAASVSGDGLVEILPSEASAGDATIEWYDGDGTRCWAPIHVTRCGAMVISIVEIERRD